MSCVPLDAYDSCDRMLYKTDHASIDLAPVDLTNRASTTPKALVQP